MLFKSNNIVSIEDEKLTIIVNNLVSLPAIR
jgi:hypothetical protein